MLRFFSLLSHRLASISPTFPLTLHRFLSQSTHEDDIYDPPFSPIHKSPNPKKSNNKTSKEALSTEEEPKFPFDFKYSYCEIDDSVGPLSFRESPKFSPFGPGRLDRKWNGTSAPVQEELDQQRWEEERNRVLGDPLSEEEADELVERYRHSDCARQINLGKGGVTYNMLDDIHNHLKRAEAVGIKCLGVPTLDTDNVCFHLEGKSGGKIIYRHINILLLYRGRNYDPKNRPVIPLMLWKPYAPIYLRLVKKVIEGLTYEEMKEIRNRARNGVYVYAVCTHVGASDCKKIGVKLRDLVPCVPIIFKDEQIILWRGNVN